MEVGLVRHAADYATDEELSELRDALVANRQSIGDSSGFIKTDIAFHFVLAKIMSNPVFIALHEALSAWLLQQREIALLEPGEDARGYEAHARIFEAVNAKDADAAESAMRDHLESGWISFWRRFHRGDADADLEWTPRSSTCAGDEYLRVRHALSFDIQRINRLAASNEQAVPLQSAEAKVRRWFGKMDHRNLLALR